MSEYQEIQDYITEEQDNSMVAHINLKLTKTRRDEFKNAVKKTGVLGMSMQSVLLAFVESYIDDPDKFQIQIRMLVNGIDE